MARSPRTLPSAPFGWGVFTAEQAAAAGWTSDALRYAVRTGRVDRLWRGAYALPVADDAAGRSRRRTQRAVAATLANAGARVSHLTSAEVWGWPAWAPGPLSCITHDGELGLTTMVGVHVHRAHLAPRDRWRLGPVPVTSPARTVCDIAREHGPEAGLCAADAAGRAGDVRLDDLHRAARQSRGWPGARAVPPVLELWDPRSESVLETRSRWAMPAHGIPRPLTQVVLRDLAGRFVARVDFFWPTWGVVGEADGRVKYAAGGRLGTEKDREDAVRRLRLGVVRWGWDDLYRFDVVAARLFEAVADQADARRRPRRWVMTQDPVAAYRHAALDVDR